MYLKFGGYGFIKMTCFFISAISIKGIKCNRQNENRNTNFLFLVRYYQHILRTYKGIIVFVFMLTWLVWNISITHGHQVILIIQEIRGGNKFL